MAFLKGLQEGYFAPLRKAESVFGDTYLAWQHRLGSISAPADAFIQTVKADALAMIVKYSGSEDCLLQWICKRGTSCAYIKKDKNKPPTDQMQTVTANEDTIDAEERKMLVMNRRLVLMEYPFLINFAAVSRIRNWNIDADELLNFYLTFEGGAKINKDNEYDAYSLIKSLCGFLNTIYNQKGKEQIQASASIGKCIEIVANGIEDYESRVKAWYSKCKKALRASPFFAEQSSGEQRRDDASPCCKKCCTKTDDENAIQQQEVDDSAIGKFCAYLVGFLFIEDSLLEEVKKHVEEG